MSIYLIYIFLFSAILINILKKEYLPSFKYESICKTDELLKQIYSVLNVQVRCKRHPKYTAYYDGITD